MSIHDAVIAVIGALILGCCLGVVGMACLVYGRCSRCEERPAERLDANDLAWWMDA